MNKLVALLWLSLLLVACGSKTDVEYLAAAQSHLQNNEVQAAIIEAKNALKQNPKNGQARLLLGQLQLMDGNPSAAEKELTTARELGVPTEQWMPLLSQAFLQQGKWGDLKGLASEGLESKTKADVLANQALAFMSDGDMGQAKQLIADAQASSPDSVAVLLAAARLQLMGREFGQVRETLNRAIEIDPKQAQVWSLMGELERFQSNNDAAEEAFTKAINLGGRTLGDRLKRAEARIRLNKLDLAQQDLDIVLKESPNHPLANYAQGQIYILNKKPDDAIGSFEKTVRVQQDFAPALFALAAAQMQQRNFEQAELYAYKFVAQSPESVQGHRILAMVLFQNGKFAEAEEQARKLLSINSDDPAAMNMLASILFKSGKQAESVQLLEKVAELHPESAYAQLRLGAGLMAEGKTGEGEALMEKAIALNPDFHQADVMLIMHYLQQKDFDQAKTLAESLLEKRPESPLPYDLIGGAQMGLKAFDDAKQSFKKALELQPGDLTANNNLAMLALREKKVDEARGYYNAILKHHENHLQSLMRLAALDAIEKKKDDMVAKLQRAMDVHPEAIGPRLVYARYLITQKQPEKIPGLFQGLDASATKNPDVLAVMGAAQLANKSYTDARLTLEQLVVLKPESAKVQYLLARAYAGEKDFKNMGGALEKAVSLRPDYFDARLSLASYLVNVDPKSARDHIEILKKTNAESAQVRSLDAIVQNKLGDPQKALDVYSKAYKDNPVTSNLMLLARQHIYMKNRATAIQLLEDWLAQHPEDVVPSMLLANEYIATDQPSEKIIGQYEAILKHSPENVVAMNNLAWNLRESDPKKALEYASKANQLKPDSAMILDTLAVLQLKNDQLIEAQRSIRQALKFDAENPNVRYHVAMIEHAAGDSLSAEERLTTLLQEEGSFRLRDEAEALLKTLQK